MRGEPEEQVQKAIKYFRHYGQGCDLAICMTKSLGEHIQEILGIQRVLIVPNGSDPDMFRPDVTPTKRMEPFKNKFNVVWVGSAKIVYHDFDLLQQVAQLIWERGEGDRINFHIIGPDLTARMADMTPNVYYWGAEIYERMPAWLASMDVGLYLTRGNITQHSTPLKLFDYLASGLTVVSTSQSFFIRDLFYKLGQSELLISPGDSVYLAKVLLDLASNKERAHCQGQAGRKLIVEQYNWKKSVQDTMHEMESLLRAKKKRGIF
jgi:glycosyltransferase involved in cell wall biosynthesis